MSLDSRFCLRSVLVALCAVALGGCASSPWRNPFSSFSLPSPWATVKASETEAGAKQPTNKTAKAKGSKAGDNSLTMELLRGRNFEQGGELDKARKVYEDLRRKSPNNADVAHRLGVVADKQKRHTEAETLFLEALEQEPRDPELLADLGYCYFLQGKLIKAQSALIKATTMEPSNSLFRNNLGLVEGHLGNYNAALANFKAAGTDADAYFNLAFIYAAQNQHDKAKQCFQLTLNSDPSHERARDALRSFEEYERIPAEMRDDEFIADNGMEMVPYVERPEGQTTDTAVRQAAAEMPLPSSRQAGQATRALFKESRGMLNRNMQSQRGDTPTGGVEL